MRKLKKYTLVMKMNYEESVKRLREICDRLRDENTSLEETAKLYKEGSKLLEECKKMLGRISAELSEEKPNE